MCMPDVMFSASQFSRVLSACGYAHLEVGMQALRYAYGQRERVFFDFEVTIAPVSELQMTLVTIPILRMVSHNMAIQSCCLMGRL